MCSDQDVSERAPVLAVSNFFSESIFNDGTTHNGTRPPHPGQPARTADTRTRARARRHLRFKSFKGD